MSRVLGGQFLAGSRGVAFSIHRELGPENVREGNEGGQVVAREGCGEEKGRAEKKDKEGTERRQPWLRNSPLTSCQEQAAGRMAHGRASGGKQADEDRSRQGQERRGGHSMWGRASVAM